jgi:UDP-N-acetylmuramyl pentapeptide synthase
LFDTGRYPWSLILKNLSGRLVAGDLNCRARGVSTDSRTIEKGNLFVALAGPFSPRPLNGGRPGP